MPQFSDMYANLPGQGLPIETYEAATRILQSGLGVVVGGQISSACVDAGNSPTYQIRAGLVLGQITSTLQWTNYSATATDGSQVAAGVLFESLRMQDLQGNAQSKWYGILVGGAVRALNLLGLDGMARQQMSRAFRFDDDWPGEGYYPWKTQLAKTTAYTVLSADNGTQFTNTGAVAPVTFTLPAIANGLIYGFLAVAAQNMLVTSAEGTNIITANNASASTIAFQTGGDIIGGSLRFYSNPAGTKWIMEKLSGNAITIS